MNLRRPNSFQQRCRAVLSALETPGLTSAAVLGSAAWIGTVIPAAAILAPGAAQSDLSLALKSALAGIDDNTAGFGPGPAGAELPTPARLERLRNAAQDPARPIVVKITPAAQRLLLATSHVSHHAAPRRAAPQIHVVHIAPAAPPRIAYSVHAPSKPTPSASPPESIPPPRPEPPK